MSTEPAQKDTVERDEHRSSTERHSGEKLAQCQHKNTQWREMSTGPAQEDTNIHSGERWAQGQHRKTQGREMSTGPAQEDTAERDEHRASTGR